MTYDMAESSHHYVLVKTITEKLQFAVQVHTFWHDNIQALLFLLLHKFSLYHSSSWNSTDPENKIRRKNEERNGEREMTFNIYLTRQKVLKLISAAEWASNVSTMPLKYGLFAVHK